MSSLILNSPAKINLFLAITERRPDGFHNLVSVVSTLAWGDTLNVEPAAEFSLTCSDAALPSDSSNLILKAAHAFRKATGYAGGAAFHLEKRIPVGAGLGGGSSNAAAALRALNELAGGLLDDEALSRLAAEVGSDCPLFLRGGSVVLRGRGEHVSPLSVEAGDRIRGRAILVFKPAFGISTLWAFGKLAAGAPGSYLPTDVAERTLVRWEASNSQVGDLLFNNMEASAFAKFPALPALLERLSKKFGLRARMSGSGSACYALLDEDFEIPPIKNEIYDAWGKSAFVVQTRFE